MPLDWNHKRQLRKEVATQALRVVEAQYQDAVRQQLDRLYQAYIDVLAARETVRFAHTSVEGLNRLLALAEALHAGGERTIADVDRIRIQRDAAEVGVAEAEASLQEALRSLAPLLNISPDTAEQLELRGSIRDQTPPPAGDLVPIALESRPDLAAYRLGLKYAQADARLARRERFQDVYAMYQPYTFQNNEPFGTKSAHSWGVGLTVPLPIFDRNQGRIQRADVNVSQTRIELAALEQQVATEVRQAERRYQISRASVERIENSLLPAAVKVRDEALRRYRAGQDDLSVFLNAQREYNELVRQYRDTMIRHRRSMLALNTAVGRRILP
jgi:cobalt-zinc-cadmium efflux system outer membrane protein